MDISKISIGESAPEQVNVIIENTMGGPPVKYELDKDSGAVFVDRFLHTPMFYPGNYGFIPHTLSEDGDPVDVLVIGNTPVMPGAVIAVRPIAVLMMEDDGGLDEKIIARPITKLFPYHADEDLEKGKWVKIGKWGNADDARRLVNEGIDRLGK